MIVKRNYNNCRGYILYDVVIGMLILSVALVALGALFSQSTVHSTANSNYARACYIASDRMEKIKATDGNGAFVVPSAETIAATTNPAYPQFTVTVTRATVSGVGAAITPVQVDVSWQEKINGSNQARTVTVYGYHISSY